MAIPTIIVPGYFAGASPYRSMEVALGQEGIEATTVPLRRQDWWPTIGGRPVTPILQKLHDTIQAVCELQGVDRVHVVGHSAGGWIARIYLGDRPYGPEQKCWNGSERVASLTTLGTPHTSQERWTKNNIDFVNNMYPGAYCNTVQYLCVAGKSVYGQRRLKTWIAYRTHLGSL